MSHLSPIAFSSVWHETWIHGSHSVVIDEHLAADVSEAEFETSAQAELARRRSLCVRLGTEQSSAHHVTEIK